MQQSYPDQKDHQTKTVVASAANSCQVRPQRNTAAAAQRMIWQRALNSEVGMRNAEIFDFGLTILTIETI